MIEHFVTQAVKVQKWWGKKQLDTPAWIKPVILFDNDDGLRSNLSNNYLKANC